MRNIWKQQQAIATHPDVGAPATAGVRRSAAHLAGGSRFTMSTIPAPVRGLTLACSLLLLAACSSSNPTPPPVLTLGTGGDPASSSVPGGHAGAFDGFSLVADASAPVTSVTVNLTAGAAALSDLFINTAADCAGTTFGTLATPVAGNNLVPVTGLTAGTTVNNYYVCGTGASVLAPTDVTGYVTSVAATGFTVAGSDSSPATLTVTPVPPGFTLHFHRALSDYAGWTVVNTAGAVEASVTSSSTDGFGAIYSFNVAAGATTLDFTLKNGGVADLSGPLSVVVSGALREAWVFSGFAEAITRKLPAIPTATQFAVYYGGRVDNQYGGWGLHTWGDQVTGTDWAAPLAPRGIDSEFGAGFLIDLQVSTAAGNCTPGQVCFIVHKADLKDPGADMGWDPRVLGNIVFVSSGSASISPKPRRLGAVSIDGAGAHLLTRGVLAWNVAGAASVELRASPTGAIGATDTDVTGGTVLPLTANAAGLDAAFLTRNPQFNGYARYDLAPGDQAAVPAALQGQLVAVARKADNSVLAATTVQRALAIDDLFAYSGPLGVSFATVAGTPTFNLWAPTATSVKLHVHDADAARTEVAGSPFTMTRGTAGTATAGVWSRAGNAAWYGKLYRFEVVVFHPTTGRVETLLSTDPYAVSLASNGAYAQIYDLADPLLKPAGWGAMTKPALAAPEDIVVYESHIRDFSALDPTTPIDRRGKYLGFVTPPAGTPSAGLAHLQALATAGLTHIHLLPAFDFATVDEDPTNRVDLGSQFADLCAKQSAVPTATCGQFAGKTVLEATESFAGDSDQQQLIAGWMRNYDSFNWGYDPLHYGAPEGSYASTAEGSAKILEFRQMVQGLASIGLRVVMDVVYNHTNAAGVTDKAVLDKLVPGYYHRLTIDTGSVESTSCCANTATEHVMMGRLMTDTMVRWAREYRVDGFRWDLMGLHKKEDVLKTQAALAALTVGADGVDGTKLYLYGEGWDMGELGSYKQGVAATQINMSGTGIGTFNDRIRDATRGGSAFDSLWDLRLHQGFATGLVYDPNERSTGVTPTAAQVSYGDWVKIGMAGNLRDFRLVDVNGVALTGMSVGYNGVRAGYTQDPQEAINYVSAHDNQVLFDIVQAKLPTGTSMANRVRAVNVALDVVLLGQGIPFIHMGDDLLRSKSFERDSYDSGDWFNRISWTGVATAGWSGPPNGWKSGLPNASKDAGNWPLVTQLFADATIAPTSADVTAASTHFKEMLAVRKSSRLFRLTSGADVMKRVDFLNVGPSQVPGVIVMTITDGTCAGADLDATWDAVVVVINATTAPHDMVVPGASGFVLHPVLASSADATVKLAAATGTSFHVPARTSAVFVQPQGASQGAGLACNMR